MQQQAPSGASTSAGDEKAGVTQYHIRASQWFEDKQPGSGGLSACRRCQGCRTRRPSDTGWEAAPALTQHGDRHPGLAGIAANDGVGCQARVVGQVRWVPMINGQTTGVEEKLQAAEAALAASASGFEQSSQPDAETRNLIGIIATARATLAVAHTIPRE